ncbi:hypothetical protein [Rummeliibacillus stabekisii]|uniref:Uncharacterized protein n=1 Tax=Rummeliibacillus stabekisii TaxID=241244 RepID=A0A143HDK3_9BACL|nr:hypothetical protein [Rummeliibacillus stabekisii]AMW99331.1 hypothetical protein ATY39_07550 [Rummeliibacillus stabekisii]
MEKIKISQQVASAIKAYFNNSNTETERAAKISLLDAHANRLNNPNVSRWAEVNEDCAALDQLNLYELSEILVRGYEVIKTPEEIVMEIYNAPSGSYSFEHQKGVQKGIALMAQAYNIPLEGVSFE